MDPKISVIIPTKNRAHYVSSAVQSVLGQTFGDFEVLIVDGASTDNTREVVSKFHDERIRYIRERKDRGASASRNTGISQSRGKFIAFLDDDDLWVPSKLSKQLNLFDKNPCIGAVSAGAWIINENDETIGFRIPSLRGNIFPKILSKNHVGNCSMVLVRKECFEKSGLFDENLEASEDYDLWVRLTKHYEFDYVNEPLVLYRVHEKRISTNPYKALRAKKLLIKKHSKELTKLSNHRRILGSWQYRLGVLYCKCGDMGHGKKEFLKAIRNDPFSIRYYARLFASFFGLTLQDALDRLLKSSLPIFLQFQITGVIFTAKNVHDFDV